MSDETRTPTGDLGSQQDRIDDRHWIVEAFRDGKWIPRMTLIYPYWGRRELRPLTLRKAVSWYWYVKGLDEAIADAAMDLMDAYPTAKWSEEPFKSWIVEGNGCPTPFRLRNLITECTLTEDQLPTTDYNMLRPC